MELTNEMRLQLGACKSTKDIVRTLYGMGFSRDQIAEYVGKSYHAVYKITRDMGPHRTDTIEHAEIVARVENDLRDNPDWRGVDLAAKYNVSPMMVSMMRQRLGLEPRRSFTTRDKELRKQELLAAHQRRELVVVTAERLGISQVYASSLRKELGLTVSFPKRADTGWTKTADELDPAFREKLNSMKTKADQIRLMLDAGASQSCIVNLLGVVRTQVSEIRRLRAAREKRANGA